MSSARLTCSSAPGGKSSAAQMQCAMRPCSASARRACMHTCPAYGGVFVSCSRMASCYVRARTVERFEEGARQFRDDVAVNPNDTEESIWCALESFCLACGMLHASHPTWLSDLETNVCSVSFVACKEDSWILPLKLPVFCTARGLLPVVCLQAPMSSLPSARLAA
eukprot:365584-Chlamydomonas_euryale.AAC.21